MLDLKYIKNNIEEVKKAMAKRKAKINFSLLLENEEGRKTLLLEIETLRHKRNIVSDDIAAMKKSGKDAQSYIDVMKIVSEKTQDLDKELVIVEKEIHNFLILMPNLPHKDVPIGDDDTENIINPDGSCDCTCECKNCQISTRKKFGCLCPDDR